MCEIIQKNETLVKKLNAIKSIKPKFCIGISKDLANAFV